MDARAAMVVISYQECLKNHAACMGAHALDGCGGYLPSLELNPAHPATFTCVACSCHRDFHRRVIVEVESPPPPAQPQVALVPAPPMAASVLHGPPQRREKTPEDRIPEADGDDSESDSHGSEYDGSVSPPQLQQAPPTHLFVQVGQQAPLTHVPGPSAPQPAHVDALPGATQSQRLPVQVLRATAPPAHVDAPARRRPRTIFTAEQKQRMQELSERLGWRLQKRDEAIVDEWCRDIGVSKGVFKAWVYNNKHNYMGGHSARRSASATAVSSVTTRHTAPAATGPFPSRPPPAHYRTHRPCCRRRTIPISPTPAATGFNVNGTGRTATSAVTPTPTFTAYTK